MRPRKRKIRNWTLRALLVLFSLAVIYVATLAFPYPLFAHQETFGEFKVLSTRPLPEDMAEVIEDVRLRLGSMEHSSPGASYTVFICGDRPLYSFFTSLVRKGPNSLAFCLSAFRNIYVNAEHVEHMAQNNPWGILHSRFEGNLAEVIAHEIAHFHVVGEIGYRASMRMPAWKSEGYAEYQANLAATKADTAYSLSRRIDLLFDPGWGQGSVAQELYEWQVLVEYLGDIKGYGLAELIDEGVTLEGSRQEMYAWFGTKPSTE